MTSNLRPATAGRNWHSALWLLLLVVLFALGVERLDPAFGGAVGLADARAWQLALLGAIPFLLVVLLVCALTRRVLLASWIGGLLLAATFGANAVKVEQLEMPLLPGDFHFLQEIGSSWPLFSHYLGSSGMVLLVVAVILLLTLALVRETPWPAMRGWRRLALATFTLVMATGLLVGWTPWRVVYSAEHLQFAPWSVVDSARQAGVVGNLVLYNWELARRQNLKPDRSAAVRLLGEHAEELRARQYPNHSAWAMPSDTRPDIVIVQSESLFDPARLRNAPARTYLPNYHRLAKRGLSGEMSVPTYAGGTIRTEFEVLTGLALAFFPGVQYPYYEIADRPIPGIVRTLGSQGYRTTAIHPNTAVFWNRRQALQQIGFDAFIDDREFSKDDIVGLFIGDAALTDKVLQNLDEQGPPQLLFAISMENHGPFDWRPGLDVQRLKNLKVPPNLSEGGDYWLRNYLYLLEDADNELGRLAAALEKRKRRTLLLFYGDHLPGLGPVYEDIGFADGGDAKSQPVPWLLLDNGRDLVQGAPMNTTSWMLPGLLLEAAGIQGDSYFATLSTLRDALPPNVMSASTSLPAELRALGQLRYRNELEPIMQQVLDGSGTDPASTIAP